MARGRGPDPEQPFTSQIEELIALEALQRQRALTDSESERLGVLVKREQQRARYRPARIARLRRELDLLEMLEMAEKGAAALPAPRAREVEMLRAPDGRWIADAREVA